MISWSRILSWQLWQLSPSFRFVQPKNDIIDKSSIYVDVWWFFVFENSVTDTVSFVWNVIFQYVNPPPIIFFIKITIFHFLGGRRGHWHHYSLRMGSWDQRECLNYCGMVDGKGSQKDRQNIDINRGFIGIFCLFSDRRVRKGAFSFFHYLFSNGK